MWTLFLPPLQAATKDEHKTIKMTIITESGISEDNIYIVKRSSSRRDSGNSALKREGPSLGLKWTNWGCTEIKRLSQDHMQGGFVGSRQIDTRRWNQDYKYWTYWLRHSDLAAFTNAALFLLIFQHLFLNISHLLWWRAFTLDLRLLSIFLFSLITIFASILVQITVTSNQGWLMAGHFLWVFGLLINYLFIHYIYEI